MIRTTCLVVMMIVLICAAAAVIADDPAVPAAPAPSASAAPVVKPSVMPAPYVSQVFRLVEPRMVPMLAARLQLTEDEKAKVTKLLTDADKAIEPVILAQKAAEEEFAAALVDKSTTQEALLAAGQKATQAEQALLNEKIKTLFSLRAALNDEQNQKLDELLKQYTRPWQPQATSAPPSAAN